MHPDSSMVAAATREIVPVQRARLAAEGTLGQIDTVDERLRVLESCTDHEARVGRLLLGHLAMVERIDLRERRDGSLESASMEARGRLNRRIGDLVNVLFVRLPEQRAEIEGARRHLGWARQSARIDTFIARHLDDAGLTEVAS